MAEFMQVDHDPFNGIQFVPVDFDPFTGQHAAAFDPALQEGTSRISTDSSGNSSLPTTDQGSRINPAATFAANDGTPGNNQAQNQQVRDVVRILGMSANQRQELHRRISGQGYGFHEILEIGREIVGK